MKRFIIWGWVVLFTPPLLATPYAVRPEPPSVQELRTTLEQLSFQMHSHESELDLFQERLQKMEKTLKTLSQHPLSTHDKSLEKRLTVLEQANTSLIDDFKLLKTHLNETNTSLAACQSQLTKIDKQLTSDVQSLKNSLKTMLALLQNGASEPNTYIVQTGDSLGQIALDHKTDIKSLKKLNNLSSDTIYVGQKILLP